MKKTDSVSFTDRIRSWASTKAHGPSPLSDSSRPTLPISNPPSDNTADSNHDRSNIPPFPSTDLHGVARQSSKSARDNVADNTSTSQPPPAPPPQVDSEGAVIDPGTPEKKNIAVRFWLTGKAIIFSSYLNLLLVFVPVGIACQAADLSPGLIFGMNAIAIIPLAGLLSHATESVAKRMGDTVGALMNVTFGNAVELIIFIIALVKNEIRIVQASLLGSILANLLLILGMSFLIGGLRYREQIYNSTVTQMSACLLSLSVMSLLLPTAFHASFSTLQSVKATNEVLKVSRGTSVVLLIVYVLYLLFQLKSHAYMYESTPQHIIDEESAPGPVAAWMESSSDDSSSSSSSDSDDSSSSNTTAKRIRRVMRGGHRRRRKSSSGSKDTVEELSSIRTPSFGTGSMSPIDFPEDHHVDRHRNGNVEEGEEGGDEDNGRSRKSSVGGSHMTRKERKKLRKHQEQQEREERRERRRRKKAKRNGDDTIKEDPIAGTVIGTTNEKTATDEPRRVDFAVVEPEPVGPLPAISESQRRFNLGSIMRPAIPKTFSQNVFTQPAADASPAPAGPIPRVRYGIRRTNSLPDRLNQPANAAIPPNLGIAPMRISSLAMTGAAKSAAVASDENISRTTAVMLLLISTGLVAVCAEFMVDSINAVVASNSGISEAFIGLIILPIVGNAAEHVTAVTVATKNKMDLAIGVAVGSSIQIALFVTPFVVLLGWAMGKDMSLYFTLFETVCLFVSAFIVNFLVLDGRSNYLEGALLCAAYVIIAVGAFFYPKVDDASSLGGNPDSGTNGGSKMMAVRALGELMGL